MNDCYYIHIHSSLYVFRFNIMATLNEQEQHIFETLLNQTDAVSPGVDKSQHQEHARG